MERARVFEGGRTLDIGVIEMRCGAHSINSLSHPHTRAYPKRWPTLRPQPQTT